MINNKYEGNAEISPRMKKSLLVISIIGTAGSLLLFIPHIRSLIITFGEAYIVHRPLNKVAYWQQWIISLAYKGAFLSIIFLYTAITPKKYHLVYFLTEKLSNETVKQRLVTVCSAVLLFNLLRYLNLPVASNGLDPSWLWALNTIANNHSSIFGRDMTFTYGPLGYLFAGGHYGINIIKAIGLNIFCIGLLSALFYVNNKKGKLSGQNNFVFFLLLWPFAGIQPFEWTWNLMLFLLFSTCWTLRKEKRIYIPLIFMSGIICAISLLLKFNTAVFAIALAGILGLVFLLYDIKKLVFYIPLFFGSYIAITILNAVYFFKGFGNFILWIRMSLEISGGFSYAMATKGLFVYVIIAFIVMLLYVYLADSLKKSKNDNWPLFLLGAVVIFFSFKHGFVRQDGAHMLNFFSVMPFLTGFMFLFLPGDYYKKGLNLFKATVFICLICVMSVSGSGSAIKSFWGNIYYVSKLPENYRTFQERKDSATRVDVLPAEWNADIAGKSIQIVPWELSYAEANHWDAWQPNPVLQLYSVYTKTLDEYSASSFGAEKAPALVLLEYNTIDGRNMFLDTPATWNIISPNYRIARNDGQRLLLEKNSEYKKTEFIPIDSGRYGFNETITIPEMEGPLYAKITIENSILGKIITTLFRGNPPQMTLAYQNGSEITCRIIADTLRNPVLINYIPGNFEQTAAFFNNEHPDEFAVSAIKISAQARFFYYRRNIRIEWFLAG